MTIEMTTEKLIKGALIHTATLGRTPIEVKIFASDVVGVLSDDSYVVYFNKKTVTDRFTHPLVPILVYRNEKGEITDRAGNICPEFAHLIDVDLMIFGWRNWDEVEDDVHERLVNIMPIDWNKEPTTVDWDELID